MKNYNSSGKTVGPDTDSVAKRSIGGSEGKSNTHAGKEYKKDFAKDGTEAPSSWGNCCTG